MGLIIHPVIALFMFRSLYEICAATIHHDVNPAVCC